MQTDLFEIHHQENNSESQENLDKHRIHFSKQCAYLFDYLMAGNKITVKDAINNHNINSLPRRILDLRDKGFQISSTWIKDGHSIPIKNWYISELNKEFNILKLSEQYK